MPVDGPVTKVITNHLMTHLKMKIFQNSEGWHYGFKTRKGISVHKMSVELAAFRTSLRYNVRMYSYMCNIHSVLTSLCLMLVKKFQYKFFIVCILLCVIYRIYNIYNGGSINCCIFSHKCMQQIMVRLWEIVCRIWVELVRMQWLEGGTFTHERWLLVSHQLSVQQGM
jgi:hypothetical protein